MRAALRITAALLVLAVIPVWPYAYYTLLRVVVTGVGIAALIRGFGGRGGTLAGLLVTVLLFNPVAPIFLGRLAWLPIDIAVAAFFLYLSSQENPGRAAGY